eukprot:5969534-Amphidinium_carterae.1
MYAHQLSPGANNPSKKRFSEEWKTVGARNRQGSVVSVCRAADGSRRNGHALTISDHLQPKPSNASLALPLPVLQALSLCA